MLDLLQYFLEKNFFIQQIVKKCLTLFTKCCIILTESEFWRLL